MSKSRDEFSARVKVALADRVGGMCSNPDCVAATSGPAVEPVDAVNVGVAAHITAASPGGPRYDSSLTPEARASIQNGIWLCQTCSRLVDTDVERYPPTLLFDWKRRAEDRALLVLGKAQPPAGGGPFTLHAQLAAAITGVQALMDGSAASAFDADLDEAKRELERHRLDRAEWLIDRLHNRHGDKLSDRQRWRAKSILAGVRLSRGELESGGQLLLEAYTLQPSEEKAKINRVVGLELVGRAAEAHEAAAALRTEFPASSAVLAVWVRTAPDSVTVADATLAAGTMATECSDVAVALAMHALKRGDAEIARRHAAAATRLDPNAPHGWLQAGYATHELAQAGRTVETQAELRAEAVASYTRSVDLAAAHDNVPLRVSGLVNRGIVQALLDNPSLAEDDFRDAIRLAPDEPDIATQYALFLAGRERPDDVVTQAERAARLGGGPKADFLYAAALYDRNRGDDRPRAVEQWSAAARTAANDMTLKATECAVVGLCRLKMTGAAQALLNGLPSDRLPGMLRSVLNGRIRLAEGGREEAIKIAIGGLESLTADTPEEVRWSIAEFLARLNLYYEAVSAVRRLVRRPAFDIRTKMVLDWANFADDHGAVLRLCRELREAGVRDERLGRNEFEVLGLYDAEAAIDLGVAHLRAFPNDKLASLALSMLGLRRQRPELVVTDLARLPTPKSAPPKTVGRAVITLLLHAGRSSEALRYGYESLRCNPSDADANHGYVTLFLSADMTDWPLDAGDVVGPDAAVLVCEDDGSGPPEWITIESNNPEPLQDEYPPDHPKVRPLMGKRVGEVVLLSTGLQPRWGKIVEIRSKYVRRFEAARDGYQAEFPDHHDFQMVRVVRPTPSGEQELDLSPIQADLARRREHVAHCLEQYRTRPIPIHFLSIALGLDLFETMDGVCQQQGVGMHCAAGNDQERRLAEFAVNSETTLVLDLTALYTLARLGLLAHVGRWQVGFVASQQTVDHLMDLAHDNPRLRRFGYFVGIGDQVGIAELPEAEAEAERVQRDGLVTWVRNRCSVVSCQEVADLEPRLRNQLWTSFGRDGVDSMALAARPGHVLWTDDWAHAQMANSVFGAYRRTWTQMALHTAVLHNHLGLEDFNPAAARIIGWRYEAAWYNPEILAHAAKLADHDPVRAPLVQALEAMRRAATPRQQRIGTAAEFVAKLFLQTSSRPARQRVVWAILDTFPDRWWADELHSSFDRSHFWNDLERIEAKGLIRRWRNGASGQ